jgi:site-specific recombinase XerD
MNILFYLKDSKNKAGEKALYVRLSQGTQITELSLGVRMKPSQFKSTSSKQYMNAVQAKLLEIEGELLLQSTCTPQMIKHEYLSRTTQVYNLLDVWDQYLVYYQKNKLQTGEVKEVSYDKFVLSQDYMKKYLRELKLTDIPLNMIHSDFIMEFFNFLRRSVSHNHAQKMVSKFKTVIIWAHSKGWITKTPFTQVKIRPNKTKVVYLVDSELKRLHKTKYHPRLEKVRDAFLFQCYTGLAYIDMSQLTQEMIEDNKIMIDRQKTGEPCYIPLMKPAKEILEKYRYKLPVNSNQKMNAYLKEVGTLAKINKELHTHVGRHTFATIALNNGMPVTTLQVILGHSDIRTTMKYAKLIRNTIDQDMVKLEDKLSAIV